MTLHDTDAEQQLARRIRNKMGEFNDDQKSLMELVGTLVEFRHMHATRLDGGYVDVLRRLKAALPTVGINGWMNGVAALDAAITALSAQPPRDRDAYEGAREDLLDWKGRAQRAEARLRALGYAGTDASEPPAQPAPERQGDAFEDAVKIAAHECSKHAYAYWHDGPESATYYDGGMPNKSAHEEPYARIIRRVLADYTAAPVGVADERIIELAERLVAAGPKASHVSASECHEISEFILSLAAPSAPQVEQP